MNPCLRGVPFGRRSPLQRGPYSTPKHTRDDARFMTAREVVAQEGRRLLVRDGVEEADGEGRAAAFGTRVRVTAAMRLRPWRWP